MTIKVVIPQLGQSIAEATILRWLKKEGDSVSQGESIVEIGTDKINSELPAPASGVISKLLVPEGTTVPVNSEIAEIAEDASANAAPGASSSPTLRIVAERNSEPGPDQRAGAEDRRIRSSPYVRRLAREQGVELASLRGTGDKGRITKDDISSALEGRDLSPSRITVEERVPIPRMRKLIAEHMIQSRRTAADVTTVFEVDMTTVVQRRDDAREAFAREHGIKLTYLPFVIAAVIKGIRDYPVLNASMDETSIVYKKQIHVGIAVAIENGLIVPVIKNADEKNVLGLARSAHDLSERARANKLLAADVEGGTFTITNPGVYGALIGTPIIHQPQAAILGLGAVVKRPVVINDAIAIRSMAYLSLSYDHRLLDGATADQFLARVKWVLENECPEATV